MLSVFMRTDMHLVFTALCNKELGGVHYTPCLRAPVCVPFSYIVLFPKLVATHILHTNRFLLKILVNNGVIVEVDVYIVTWTA